MLMSRVNQGWKTRLMKRCCTPLCLVLRCSCLASSVLVQDKPNHETGIEHGKEAVQMSGKQNATKMSNVGAPVCFLPEVVGVDEKRM